MIRLVALDVDGTLLTSDHRVTARVAAEIARIRARGVEVVLASSRPPRALWPVLSRLGLVEPAWFVASQGALVGSFTAEGVLRVRDQQPMPVAPAHQVVRAALTVGASVNWYAGARWLVPAIDAHIATESQIVGCVPEVADLLAEDRGPDKILLLGPGVGLDPVLDVPEGLVAVASTPTHLEVTRADVDKAEALRGQCRALGVGREEIMAMGDGRNDLAMLALSGTAVAPANAHPVVRARADLVTASNDEDAVAQALAALVP